MGEDRYFSLELGYFTQIKELLEEAEELSGVNITVVI